jgi:SAM-dependent methyltransferase
MRSLRKLNQHQIDYYRARAGEYDEWFYRRGRYDRGEELTRRWFAEAEVVRRSLLQLGPVASALELACGTGIWTLELVKIAQHVTAVDASPEVIAIARDKLGDAAVDFRVADVFAWEPAEPYNLVFLGFWLSHVPPERLDGFLHKVERALRPGGRLCLVDSRYEPTSTSRDQQPRDSEAICQSRRLNDGRQFRIVKVYQEAEQLQSRLESIGFCADLRVTDHYFLYGTAIKQCGDGDAGG